LPFTVTPTALSDVLIIEPSVFDDTRGFFFESFNERDFFSSTGIKVHFVQDNHSHSKKGVLRGLHYQIEQAQGKLVRVTQGHVFDVCVNLRRNHCQFGQWFGVHLSGINKKQLWIPPGFAHGFLVLSESADFVYKTTDYYSPLAERCLLWNDPALGIDWPIELLDDLTPKLTAKDLNGTHLIDADVFSK
jgi:dTDP-4-dehydrorhamnose 3,5-epimerase